MASSQGSPPEEAALKQRSYGEKAEAVVRFQGEDSRRKEQQGQGPGGELGTVTERKEGRCVQSSWGAAEIR